MASKMQSSFFHWGRFPVFNSLANVFSTLFAVPLTCSCRGATAVTVSPPDVNSFVIACSLSGLTPKRWLNSAGFSHLWNCGDFGS